MRWVIGKASQPLPAPRWPGKLHSASRISSANVKYWLRGGEPLGGAHGVTPAPFPPDMDRLESALDNLALAATNDKTVLEQLTAANLALTGTIATLTATNKSWPTRPAPAHPALRGLLARLEKSPGTCTAAITVGRMAIGSAKSTRVPPVSTKQQGTRMMPPSRTRWRVARTIRGGTSLAPDMEGWQMRSIV